MSSNYSKIQIMFKVLTRINVYSMSTEHRTIKTKYIRINTLQFYAPLRVSKRVPNGMKERKTSTCSGHTYCIRSELSNWVLNQKFYLQN